MIINWIADIISRQKLQAKTNDEKFACIFLLNAIENYLEVMKKLKDEK